MNEWIKSVKELIELATKDFKIFAFIVSVVLNGFSLWFCWTLVADLNSEREKNDTACDIRIEKERLACDVEIKLLKQERDTLRNIIYNERNLHNKQIFEMKDEQKEFYEQILKWKK